MYCRTNIFSVSQLHGKVRLYATSRVIQTYSTISVKQLLLAFLTKPNKAQIAAS